MLTSNLPQVVGQSAYRNSIVRFTVRSATTHLLVIGFEKQKCAINIMTLFLLANFV